MPSQRAREGYLLIDNRAGPGISEEFIRKSGLRNVPFAPEGKLFEGATRRCCHCGTFFLLTKGETRGRCQKCDAYVCDNPACHIDCRPFNKLVDETFEQAIRKG